MIEAHSHLVYIFFFFFLKNLIVLEENDNFLWNCELIEKWMHEFATINGLAFVMVRVRELQKYYVRFLATFFSYFAQNLNSFICFPINCHWLMLRMKFIKKKKFEHNRKLKWHFGGMRRFGLPFLMPICFAWLWWCECKVWAQKCELFYVSPS